MRRRGRDSGSGEEEPRKSGESEREQRERLAKARRERRERARANLAAKARGEESSEAEGPGGSGKEPASDEQPAERKRPAGRKQAAAEEKGAERKRPDAEKERAERKRPEERKKPAEPRKRAERKEPAAAKERAERKKPAAAKEPSRRGGRTASRRRSRRNRRGAPAGAGAKAVALFQGARSRAAVIVPRAGRAVLRAVLAFFVVFFALIGLVLRLAISAWRFARGPLRTALAALGRWTNAASRLVTPVRALTAVTALALVVLALTQFADYRSISIGNDNYAGGIQTVAPAPVTETDATGSAHSYLMIPLALVGLGLLAAAVTGRWRLCRAVALVGLVAVLVGLLHDRPAGLDTGDRPLEYEGVAATLVGGFYAQLAAGLLIMVSSLLLGRELRASASAEPAPRPSRSPSRRRIRLRRRAGVQGARA